MNFLDWLVTQKHRDDGTGDIASVIAIDILADCLDPASNYFDVCQHIAEFHDTCAGAAEALTRAYKTWKLEPTERTST